MLFMLLYFAVHEVERDDQRSDAGCYRANLQHGGKGRAEGCGDDRTDRTKALEHRRKHPPTNRCAAIAASMARVPMIVAAIPRRLDASESKRFLSAAIAACCAAVSNATARASNRLAAAEARLALAKFSL